MKAISIPIKKAEEVRKFVVENSLLDTNYLLKRDKDNLIMPVTETAKIIRKFRFVKKSKAKLNRREKKISSVKELLAHDLSMDELELVNRSYDVVGDIIILDIPKELISKEKKIADAILKMNKSAKTVLKKAGIHEGEYRTQKMQFLAGEDRKETIHRENNVLMKLDVEQVYFSPRLSNERKRIMTLVQSGETILVMFSGCAPYPVVISKNTKAQEIIGVELNPFGHAYGIENIFLNKCKNVKLISGDVRTIVPKLNMKFDRILMPLPKQADTFLDVALAISKKGTIIHLYDFVMESDFPKITVDKIENACKQAKLKYKVLDFVKCGQHSPKFNRVCVDFQII